MDPDSSRVRVSVTDAAGRPIRDGGLAVWLAATAPSKAPVEVAIALVSDARMRALNRRYRRKDAATDVLSFPADGPTKAGRHASAPVVFGSSRTAVLGDIVIATGVARRQARDAGHSYQTELRVLALHGLLHLLGYDHDARDDRGRMARTEERLRRRGGLSVGLIGRVQGGKSRRARA